MTLYTLYTPKSIMLFIFNEIQTGHVYRSHVLELFYKKYASIQKHYPLMSEIILSD